MRGDEDRRRLLLSKYLSTCFLAQYLLEAYLSHTVGQQGVEAQPWDVCNLRVARSCRCPYLGRRRRSVLDL